MNAYQRAKERARERASEWQYEFDGKCMSWAEVARWHDHFHRMAKRYGLVAEFRENGII